MKSQILACIATYECFLSKEQSEIYITGWTRAGSDIVYREIKHQVDTKTPKILKKKYSTSYGQITHLKSGSFIKPLSKEARNGDTANNPSLAIVDEYKDHLTSEIYDSLLSGMVSRLQPLIVIITTAGPSLNCPCMQEYQYVSKILDPELPEVKNEEYFVLICELEKDDDIKDESNWIKANPIVATYEGGIDFLRSELNSALAAPEKMRNVLTKNMNVWVDMKEDGYMNMTKWNEAAIDILDPKSKDMTDDFFNHFIKQECILGVDLSTKLDLTSIAFEFKKDDIYYVCQHSFIPEENYQKRLREGRYRFDLWNEQGFLTVIPGSVIDYGYVTEYIHQQEEKYGIKIKEICYDPYNATSWVNDMEDEGYTCVEIRQGPKTLNEPTKDFRDRIYDGTLKHSNDGLYSWSASNAIATQNKQEWIMLDKSKSAEKIDPMAASINAHCRATTSLDGAEKISIYVPVGINKNKRKRR